MKRATLSGSALSERKCRVFRAKKARTHIGRHVYGLAAVAFGIITLVWRDVNNWQQIQALGDVHHREILVIEKSLVSDQIVIDTIISKYCDALPLYRQSAMLKRDTGLDISRSTMDGWVMRVGEMLLPIAGAMRRELLSGTYIQADETPVDVQTRDGRGENHQGYLWQYGTPGGGVVFNFRLGRGREGPKQFLEQFNGILQTDGYAAYSHIDGQKRCMPCAGRTRGESSSMR